jgi:hypothetical protein
VTGRRGGGTVYHPLAPAALTPMAPARSTRTTIVHLGARAATGLVLGLWVLRSVESIAAVVLFPLPQLGALLCALGAVFSDRAAMHRLAPVVTAVLAAHTAMFVLASVTRFAGTVLWPGLILLFGAAAAVAAVRLQPRLTLSLASERRPTP